MSPPVMARRMRVHVFARGTCMANTLENVDEPFPTSAVNAQNNLNKLEAAACPICRPSIPSKRQSGFAAI